MDEYPVMQVRCLNCCKEQYMPAVSAISNGEASCSWCGYPGEKLTSEEWRARLTVSTDEMWSFEEEDAWMKHAIQKSNEKRKELGLEPVNISVQ